jgi:hypothetical protein
MPSQCAHVPPAYRLHKSSGRARLIVAGQHIYLGPYGSPESREKYARLIAQLAVSPPQVPQLNSELPVEELSVKELILRYKNGILLHLAQTASRWRSIYTIARPRARPKAYRSESCLTRPGHDGSCRETILC